jgi:hypothetical protein
MVFAIWLSESPGLASRTLRVIASDTFIVRSSGEYAPVPAQRAPAAPVPEFQKAVPAAGGGRSRWAAIVAPISANVPRRPTDPRRA